MDGTEAAGERSVERLARAGFGLRRQGALHLVLGWLAGRLAWPGTAGGEEASQQGAIEAVAGPPFGQVLVAVLAVGLTGYAVWRGVQAVRGVHPDASELPGWLARVTFGVRALLYGALAVLGWGASSRPAVPTGRPGRA